MARKMDFFFITPKIQEVDMHPVLTGLTHTGVFCINFCLK